MKPIVGVVGLGAMGLGVARNLVREGFVVHGSDLRRDRQVALEADGGHGCASLAALGRVCDVVIVLVVDAAQVDGALFGPDGVAANLRRGSVVIQCATVAPEFARDTGARLADLGIGMLDCPVTGGVTGAREATLSLLVSGPESAYRPCEAVLAAISQRIYRLGDAHGLGSKMKVINQLLVGVQIAAAAEAMALALRESLDPALVYDVVTHGAGNSWAFQDRVPRILSGDYRASTALDIFVKDLGLVLDTVQGTGFPLPMATAAHQRFTLASACGWGGEDDTAVIKTYPGIDLPQKRTDA